MALAKGDFLRSWGMGAEYLRDVRPKVVRGLLPIRLRAEAIPHPDLREQALSSLNTKQFHCEGGGVFGGSSRDPLGSVLSFLLPYQTLCDYLDTVTDRGPSQDPEDLRVLHQSLHDAVTPEAPLGDYYRLHPHQNDGGYIHSLIADCHGALTRFPSYSGILNSMQTLVSLYIDLQVKKHGPAPTRVPQLVSWYESHREKAPELYWWEFSAATGSTLGLFALLGSALHPEPNTRYWPQLQQLYFPWVGALHILLDYLIDQEEDRLGGDLNFVNYYDSPREATERIQWIYRQAESFTRTLPDQAFHRYVLRGLLGFYLSDRKARRLDAESCRLLRTGGSISIGLWLLAMVGRSP